ncbi:MAG: hypothetical protein IKQ39_02935 [Oscillospiraceae bacterium]|nr:hypothetical protein [Oscillospiraceae bacterium]
MHSLLTAFPAIVVLLVFLLAESRKPDLPETATGRLHVMLLLLIPLTVCGTFLYYSVCLWVSRIAVPFGKALGTVLILSAMAVAAYAVLLAARVLARLLRLAKRERLTALCVMPVLFAAEIIAYYVYRYGRF